ncbi:CocE/NonD family hydrolase [Nonomuraea sp. NN258]|uniref:CocE/NonD family hydrolase n=1 Tax=Nonomuraea antri TaxID=2730852 RepID=UPI00156A2F08|nr:CocE/NonD family hydrolase [Nonomuraea antri]NRQ37380.1 CocE/NonD family hydrolase [Nonomuraea antri]
MTLAFDRITAAPQAGDARRHLVRVRDGVRLATDVHLPADAAGGSVFPAVLVRLPYDKNSRYVFFEQAAPMFTARGYALVVQDVRGKFRSEGHTVPFLTEADDGYDTIDWIVQQPWSDGTAGMFGDSYYGYTQWAAVAAQHPALRAIVPRMTATDLAASLEPADAAAPPVRAALWLEGVEYFAHHWVDNDSYVFEPDRAVRPVIEQYEQAFRAIGKRSVWFDVIAPHRARISTPLGRHPYDARPVPVLHCVGWFDNLRLPHLRDYLALAGRPGWDAVQYLWAGAVDHENYDVALAPIAPEDDHNADAAALERMLPGYVGPALDFFDVFLKGERPAAGLDKVRWELTHDGWHTAPAWPPPGARAATLFLADAAAAAGPLPGGTLAEEPGEPESAAWVYDPDDLVPSAVPDSFAYLRTYPDESGTAGRADVLAFAGPALREPLDLAGPVTLRLAVTSTAPVFDVFAKVLDLAPDGAARMIVRGEANVRTADAPEVVEVDLGHTGYRLRPGHRLALTLAGSDYPLYLPASGTGENPWTTVSAKPSTQTLRVGGPAAAALTLTVLDEPLR